MSAHMPERITQRELDAVNSLNQELIEALEKSVWVIKAWHNMDGAADVWQIYYENAPEMQPIRAALAKRKRPKPPLEVTEEHREQGATDMERAYPRREPT